VKSVCYSRYIGQDFGLSAEDLMKALSGFFLESGFNNPCMTAPDDSKSKAARRNYQ